VVFNDTCPPYCPGGWAWVNYTSNSTKLARHLLNEAEARLGLLVGDLAYANGVQVGGRGCCKAKFPASMSAAAARVTRHTLRIVICHQCPVLLPPVLLPFAHLTAGSCCVGLNFVCNAAVAAAAFCCCTG
jgi:hypothetical protein